MNGARRIFTYNWPIYVATWSGAVVVLAVSRAWLLDGAAIVAVLWSAWSLVVSHWIYDRSPLESGTWVRALLPAHVERWVAIDAGLDAEVDLDAVLPGQCSARLDIYDGVQVHAPSVQRARASTPRKHAATPARATALPLADASCDLVAVPFSAHELRHVPDREAFFAELHRVLRSRGRVVIVEHVRDFANFVAFGPGFTHFQPRNEWLRLAALAGFHVAAETRVTPFVMALALERT